MINIRYHIVSITAIFLALGIGTLLGSTFLDRATVDQLDRNIRNAEARIAQTEEANRLADAQVAQAERRDDGLIEASETLLAGTLTDRPVLLVVAPGVDQDTVDVIRQVLENADADLRGSLALREDLAFADGVDGDLADDLGLDPDDVEGARAEVADRLVAALVAAGAPAEPVTPPEGTDGDEPDTGTTTTEPGEATVPPGPDDTTTTTDPTTGEGDEVPADDEGPGDDEPAALDGQQPEIVTALLEADLVALDPGPATTLEDPILERTGYRYVFVSQSELEAPADELLLSLLPATVTDPPLPAVVVIPTEPPVAEGAEEPPPTAVDLVRDDAGRAPLYDTVDDIDTYLGLSSTVTILADEEGVAAGHYGQGEGATALAPPAR